MSEMELLWSVIVTSWKQTSWKKQRSAAQKIQNVLKGSTAAQQHSKTHSLLRWIPAAVRQFLLIQQPLFLFEGGCSSDMCRNLWDVRSKFTICLEKRLTLQRNTFGPEVAVTTSWRRDISYSFLGERARREVCYKREWCSFIGIQLCA